MTSALEKCVEALEAMEFSERDDYDHWVCPTCGRRGDARHNPGLGHEANCRIAAALAAAKSAPTEEQIRADERARADREVVRWLRSGRSRGTIPSSDDACAIADAIERGEHRRTP